MRVQVGYRRVDPWCDARSKIRGLAARLRVRVVRAPGRSGAAWGLAVHWVRMRSRSPVPGPVRGPVRGPGESWPDRRGSSSLTGLAAAASSGHLLPDTWSLECRSGFVVGCVWLALGRWASVGHSAAGCACRSRERRAAGAPRRQGGRDRRAASGPLVAAGCSLESPGPLSSLGFRGCTTCVRCKEQSDGQAAGGRRVDN